MLLCVGALAFLPSAASSINRDAMLKAADKKTSGEYVRSHFLPLMKKPFGQADKKNLLIIGDSHAQDFLNTIVEGNYLTDYQISTRYIPVRCQIAFADDAAQYIKAKDKKFCAKSDTLEQAKEQIEEADVIFLAANWSEWSAKKLPETIEKLSIKPTQKLFVIGRKSFGKISIRSYLRMSEDELIGIRNKPETHHMEINELMGQILDKLLFVNLHQKVCGDNNHCPIFTPELKLISFDGGHLTKYGAKYIGEKLFENTPLGEL